MQHRWRRRKYCWGGGRAVREGLWLLIILLNLDQCLHFGIAVFLLSLSPRLSLVFLCHPVFSGYWESRGTETRCPFRMWCTQPAGPFHLLMVKRKDRFLRHDPVLHSGGSLNLLPLLSPLSFHRLWVFQASLNSLQWVTVTPVPVMCVNAIDILHSPSDAHGDLVPNPVRAHHALNTAHGLCGCPSGALTVIPRGLTLAFSRLLWSPVVGTVLRNDALWSASVQGDRSLLFFHFHGGFQPP